MIYTYFINSNEILGDLSYKKLVSLHGEEIMLSLATLVLLGFFSCFQKPVMQLSDHKPRLIPCYLLIILSGVASSLIFSILCT